MARHLLGLLPEVPMRLSQLLIVPALLLGVAAHADQVTWYKRAPAQPTRGKTTFQNPRTAHTVTVPSTITSLRSLQTPAGPVLIGREGGIKRWLVERFINDTDASDYPLGGVRERVINKHTGEPSPESYHTIRLDKSGDLIGVWDSGFKPTLDPHTGRQR
jgi:hypothetical protein